MTNDHVYRKRATIFAAAFAIIFCVSSSAAFSVFAGPLQEATNATAAQVALTLTIYQFSMSLFGILSGRIVDRHGPQKLMYFGGAIYAIGWILTGIVSELWMLYLTYGVIAGAGNGLLYNPALNTAMRWYPEKKGTMSGIILAAASLGPLVAAKMGAILYNSIGMNGFYAIGLLYLTIICAVGWRMSFPEEGWQPKGLTVTEAVAASQEKNYTPKEMIKTSRFWLLLLLFSFSNAAGIMMIGSLSGIAQVQLSMSAVSAANMVMVNTFANLVGRLTIGKGIDHFGEKKMLAFILTATMIGLVGLAFSTNVLMFIIFLFILGSSFGGVLVVFPPLTNNTFGTKHSGMNYGIMFFGYSIGAFIGPQIAALFVKPELGTQAYQRAYFVALLVAAIALVIDIYLIKKEERGKNNELYQSQRVR